MLFRSLCSTFLSSFFSAGFFSCRGLVFYSSAEGFDEIGFFSGAVVVVGIGVVFGFLSSSAIFFSAGFSTFFASSGFLDSAGFLSATGLG